MSVRALPEERAAFRQLIKGANFMTPDVIDIRRTGQFVVEVSEGDFMGKNLFGITVIEETESGWRRRIDMDKCIHDEDKIDEELVGIKNYYQNFVTKYLRNE